MKILISSLAGGATGLLAGLISEPIRTRLLWNANARRVRLAVMHDVLTLYLGRDTVKAGLVSEENFWARIQMPGLEYSWDKSREQLYEDTNLIARTHWLRTVLLLKTGVEDVRMSHADANIKLDRVIEELKRIPPERNWRQNVYLAFQRRWAQISSSVKRET